MKRHIGFLSVLLVGPGALVSCQDDTEHFDNKIYNTAEQTSTVFVEEEADSYVRTLQAQLAMPARFGHFVRLCRRSGAGRVV